MARRSNVLYEATPFNKPLFMPEEKEKKETFIEEAPKESSTRRKGVLHKVNAHNKAAFMPKEEKKENLFDGISMGTGQMNNASMARWDAAASKAGFQDTDAYMDSTNWLGVSKADNPFSKVNLQNAFSKESFNDSMQGLVGGVTGGGGGGASGLLGGLSGGISGIGSAVGGAIGGLISNGYESGVGNVMNTVGKIASVIPGPWGAAISGGLQILGGGVNALFGTKVDQKKLQAANKGTAEYNNFKSTATNFDDVKTATAQQGVQDAYSGGAFRSGWAEERNKQLHDARIAARQFASNSVLNNVNNLVSDQINDALANFSAYGGPINRKKKTRRMLTI